MTISINSYNINDFSDQLFYGIRYDFVNDSLEIEKIEEDGAIILPNEQRTINTNVESIVSDINEDYVGWFGSSKYLSFQWLSAVSSNLLVEVA